MSIVKELHEAAVEKGFYDNYEKIQRIQVDEFREAIMDMFNCQRLILISSEIDEWRRAVRIENDTEGGTPDEPSIVELADVAIRVADFCGNLDTNPIVFRTTDGILNIAQDHDFFYRAMHQAVTAAVEDLREGNKEKFANSVSDIAFVVYLTAASLYTLEEFEEEIHKKVEKNKSRPAMHSKRF